MDDFQEKTHEATPHRREKAAEEGHLPRSQDLAQAVILLGGLMLLWWLGGLVGVWLTELTAAQLGGEAWTGGDVPTANALLQGVTLKLAASMLPIFGGLMAIGVVAHLAQVGFMFLPEKVAPDIGHLDLVAGAERIVSLNNAVRLGFGLLKVAVVAGIGLWRLWLEHDQVMGLSSLGPGQIAAYVWETSIWTGVTIAAALVVLALVDYLYQYWKYEEDLKMSSQEIREEMKTMQGDPQIIQRRRQIMRQMAMQNLTQSVPRADAVITNPTELAIAIKYDPDKMAAPIVLAKGAGVVAQRIRRIALEHGIPIVERKELARVLYRECETNHPVPIEQYAAVAEVLKYVYQLQGKTPPGLRRA